MSSPIRDRYGWITLCLAAVFGFAGVLLSAGCDQAPHKRRGSLGATSGQGGLFDTISDNLEKLDQFDPKQMLPQICDRLNQWYQQDQPVVEWGADPLIAELPEELRNTPAMSNLDVVQFRATTTDGTESDGWYLQEAVWLKNISQTARADKFNDLAVAERLFDWTVRNLQLEPELPASQKLRHFPFEILLLGRGQAIDRAWVFILLARQQGLDAVMLGLKDESTQSIRPWLPALLTDGKLYLFDCSLGLPIPGPGGKGIATLEQARKDPNVLAQLDLDAEHPYSVHADDLKHVVALVEATPPGLSRRMALVESKLSGKARLFLTSPGSFLAKRAREVPGIAEAKLWPWPFQVWQGRTRLEADDQQLSQREMRPYETLPYLLKARALYFKGKYDDGGAKRYLLEARPSEQAMDDYRLPSETREQIEKMAPGRTAQIEAAQVIDMKQGKRNASFWLGLVAYAEENYGLAAEWFDTFTLQAWPDGPWTRAARYNLARTYEAMGEADRAIPLYEADRGPQSHGNKLRAKRLKAMSGAAAN